ncbi:MAG TPA: hypothetical protein VFY99_00620 [Solirubrobacterales bacterium]
MSFEIGRAVIVSVLVPDSVWSWCGSPVACSGPCATSSTICCLKAFSLRLGFLDPVDPGRRGLPGPLALLAVGGVELAGRLDRDLEAMGLLACPAAAAAAGASGHATAGAAVQVVTRDPGPRMAPTIPSGR